MNGDNEDDECSLKRKAPLRVALLGAGLFATNAHAPVIRKNPEIVHCIAVWSRRQESAEALVAKGFDGCNSDMMAYGGEQGLCELLQSPDLDAVIMALPLDKQPEYVTMALTAGKHVLSEKPIAPTVLEAKVLRDVYEIHFSSQLQWSVAENFRYEPAIQRATEIVQNEIGYVSSDGARQSIKM